jgi:hypothetical protein
MQSTIEPKVAATILNYNRWRDTLECVTSLQKCLYPSVEIILVDNGSTDGSFEQLKEAFPKVDIIATGKNLGYAEGINTALVCAQKKNPKYILVLNNDTVVEPDFLSPLVAAMEENGNTAAACGTIYCHHERTKIWYGGGKLIPWRGLAIHEQKGLVVEPSSLNGPRKVSFVTGCMLLFRASLLEEIGYIDERFFMYLDDVEWSARILAKGYDLLYVPKAVIYHKVLGEKESAFKLYYSVRNRLLLIRTAFPGFSRFVAERYFLMVIAIKLFIWRFTNPLFFKAASYGLKDFFAGRFYEGRGIAEFAK